MSYWSLLFTSVPLIFECCFGSDQSIGQMNESSQVGYALHYPEWTKKLRSDVSQKVDERVRRKERQREGKRERQR